MMRFETGYSQTQSAPDSPVGSGLRLGDQGDPNLILL